MVWCYFVFFRHFCYFVFFRSFSNFILFWCFCYFVFFRYFCYFVFFWCFCNFVLFWCFCYFVFLRSFFHLVFFWSLCYFVFFWCFCYFIFLRCFCYFVFFWSFSNFIFFWHLFNRCTWCWCRWRWAYWACTVPLAGAELVAVGHYMAYWFPDVPLAVFVALFGAIILVLNLVSVKSFGALEFMLSSIKVSAVIVFMVIGVLLVFVGLPGHAAAGTANLVNDGGFLPNGPASIWISMAVVMFSFGGVEMISLSAAEAKDPARSVATSVKAMIWRLSTFYVVSMAIILCLVPWQTAAQNSELTESPFVLVFSELGIPFAADIMNFVVLVAALSGANASLYAATRLLHALGSDRMAPAVAARTSSRGVPVVALLISFTGVVVATVMAVAKIGDIFALLMALVTLCILVVWVMILLTYQAYKKDQKDASSFTVLGGRVTAGLALAGVLATLAAMFMLPGSGVQESIMVGIVFFVLISIGYAISSKVQGGYERPDLDAMHADENTSAAQH